MSISNCQTSPFPSLQSCNYTYPPPVIHIQQCITGVGGVVFLQIACTLKTANFNELSGHTFVLGRLFMKEQTLKYGVCQLVKIHPCKVQINVVVVNWCDSVCVDVFHLLLISRVNIANDAFLFLLMSDYSHCVVFLFSLMSHWST